MPPMNGCKDRRSLHLWHAFIPPGRSHFEYELARTLLNVWMMYVIERANEERTLIAFISAEMQ